MNSEPSTLFKLLWNKSCLPWSPFGLILSMSKVAFHYLCLTDGSMQKIIELIFVFRWFFVIKIILLQIWTTCHLWIRSIIFTNWNISLIGFSEFVRMHNWNQPLSHIELDEQSMKNEEKSSKPNLNCTHNPDRLCANERYLPMSLIPRVSIVVFESCQSWIAWNIQFVIHTSTMTKTREKLCFSSIRRNEKWRKSKVSNKWFSLKMNFLCLMLNKILSFKIRSEHVE